MKMQMNRHQAGIGIVELMIGIVIVSALIYVVTTSGNTLFSSSGTNNFASIVTTVNNEVKSLVRVGPDTSAATTANMILGDRLETLENSAGTGYEYPPFTSVISVAPADIAPGTNNSWDVTFTNIPKSICSDATNILLSAFPEIRINGTVAKDASTDPTPADLVAACNVDANTVAYRGTPGAA